jgi:hypothetical protein
MTYTYPRIHRKGTQRHSEHRAEGIRQNEQSYSTIVMSAILHSIPILHLHPRSKVKEVKKTKKEDIPIIKLFNSPGARKYANSNPGILAKISEIAMMIYAGICRRMEISLGR